LYQLCDLIHENGIKCVINCIREGCLRCIKHISNGGKDLSVQSAHGWRGDEVVHNITAQINNI